MDEFDLGAKEDLAMEEELRRSLRHVPAPPDFTEHVMARVEQRRERRETRSATTTKRFLWSGLHRSAGVWTSIAAGLVLAVGGNVLHVRHQQQEREAAQVQAQMDLAMELTGHALDEVRGNLDRSPAGQLLNGLGK